MDRDPSMVAHARNRASSMGLDSARFVHASVEDLPADLGTFRLVTVAQAFHWFDGPRAAEAIARLLEPGGHCVVLYAWSLKGDPVPGTPLPPYAAMDALCGRLLDPPDDLPGSAPDDESGPMRAAGLTGPEGWPVLGGDRVETTVDDLISRWLSRSDTAALRTGERFEEFRAAAEKILRGASAAGFVERLRDARFNVWTKPD